MKSASVTVFLIALGCCGFVAVGQAGHDGPSNSGYSEPPPKGTDHLLQNPGTPDGRDGGENIDDAIVIPSLPFQDSGNTCDNMDDYDEICPYSGSTSPDVVYAYTPDVDILVDIDLCSEGNQYDTKLYVYCEGPGSLVACNDDLCSNSWTPYASRIDLVYLLSGFTYYIVIDGYGGDCGNFEIFMADSWMGNVECGPTHVDEGEPELVDGYVDTYNGGCNSNPPVFQPINWINPEVGCALLCGVSGWYDTPLGLYRDTDWFEIEAGEDLVEIFLISEWTTQILVSMPNIDCYTYNWIIEDAVEAYMPYYNAFQADIGDRHWIWIGPYDWVDMPDFIYDLKVCGIFDEVVPTQATSWGAVKSGYR